MNKLEKAQMRQMEWQAYLNYLNALPNDELYYKGKADAWSEALWVLGIVPEVKDVFKD